MFGYFLMGIGGLSVIILVIGFAVVMFIAARDLWKAGSPGKPSSPSSQNTVRSSHKTVYPRAIVNN